MLVGRVDGGLAASGQLDLHAFVGIGVGLGVVANNLAQLDKPQIGGQARGDMQLEIGMAYAGGGQGRAKRAAGVDHQYIAGIERVHDIAEGAMLDLVALVVRDHQAHVIAAKATRFGWLAGFELGGQLELQNIGC